MFRHSAAQIDDSKARIDREFASVPYAGISIFFGAVSFQAGLFWTLDMNGSEAERSAEGFLLQRQLVLLQRNYHCRFGEIDLIMKDGETLVFVEVRLRGSSVFGGAAASITSSKQAKLLHTARHYLGSLKSVPPCRFDAVLLSGRNGEEIEWIRDAFGE